MGFDIAALHMAEIGRFRNDIKKCLYEGSITLYFRSVGTLLVITLPHTKTIRQRVSSLQDLSFQIMPSLTTDQINAITQSVHDNFEAQLSYTQQLIRFGGQRGEEGAVQDFVFDAFATRGYAPVKFDMDESELGKHEGAGNFSPTHSRAPVVVGVHKPKSQCEGGKSLILNGHIDVVPLGPVDMWADDPYSAKIEGDKLYGRRFLSSPSLSASLNSCNRPAKLIPPSTIKVHVTLRSGDVCVSKMTTDDDGD